MDELRLNPVYYTAPSISRCASPCAASWRRRSRPHVADWDEAGGFPRELYARAADVGLLGLGFPEEYGGLPGVDYFHRLVASLELAQAGSGGVVASLMSHTIGSPPVAALGSAGTQAARAAGGAGRPAHRGAGDHRALRRLGRRRAAHHGGPRRRPLRGERREDLHHFGHARRLPHRRGAHRPRGARGARPVAAAGRGRHAGPHAHAAGQDGLVGLRHRAPALRRLPRAGRQPDRPGELRLPRRHAQLQRRALRAGGQCGRLRVGLLPGGARLGARAPHVRQAPRRPPGGATPAGGHAEPHRDGARACSRRPPGGSTTVRPATRR